MDKKSWFRAWPFRGSHPLVEKVDSWKVRYHNGYIADRRIFLFLMLVVIVFTLYGMDRYGWSFEKKVYISCDGATPCTNPFYARCEEWYCKNETFPPGYLYGERPDAFFENFGLYVSGMVLLAVIVNHLIYNRNFEFKED